MINEYLMKNLFEEYLMFEPISDVHIPEIIRLDTYAFMASYWFNICLTDEEYYEAFII